MKLQLYLSHNGVLSRRKAFEVIMAGHVSVNGSIVREPSTDVDPAADKVVCLGREVASKHFEYVVLNKPVGYVTTCEGQFDQKTVMQLLPKELKHLRPVGRLEKDTEGLIILTNDGWLANRLAHPSFDVERTYFARVRWRMPTERMARLEEGILITGERAAPAHVRILREDERESEIEITMREGKHSQVRRALNAVGNPAVFLRRIAQGPVELGNMRSGDWRRLTPGEVAQLKDMRSLPQFEEEASPVLKKRTAPAPKSYAKPNFGFRPPAGKGRSRSRPPSRHRTS
jgi:pseudouridine synthase